MRRFWLAVSLPALIALFTGKSGLILTGVAWMPVSALLLIWAFLTYRRDNKEKSELAKNSYLSAQKKEITTPKFEFQSKPILSKKLFQAPLSMFVMVISGSKMQMELKNALRSAMYISEKVITSEGTHLFSTLRIVHIEQLITRLSLMTVPTIEKLLIFRRMCSHHLILHLLTLFFTLSYLFLFAYGRSH